MPFKNNFLSEGQKNYQLRTNKQFIELCYPKFRCRLAKLSVGRRHFSTNQCINNLLTEIKTFRSLAQRNEFQPETSHVASSHPHLRKFHVAPNLFRTEKASPKSHMACRNATGKHEKVCELKNYSQDLCVCFLMLPDTVARYH